eukprot:GHRR01004233.1.p1 GENE.GHRR01004233.1~~GHRR01004233.1.p1  ORF type:complete len:342 (+),score=110.68 GHRR01004233.1:32-1057(+)
MPASNRRPLYSKHEQQQQQVPEDLAPSSDPRPIVIPAAPDTPFRQPCTLKGLASAAYAGALGYFLGFVPATFKLKARQWSAIHNAGVASASQLALMSGMYTAVHCICQRIRMVEDGWNRGVAGCSTGLVLGWKAGPWSALQSCAGLGLISALIDFGSGAVEAAEARLLCSLQDSSKQQQQKQQQQLWPCTVGWNIRPAAHGNPLMDLMNALSCLLPPPGNRLLEHQQQGQGPNTQHQRHKLGNQAAQRPASDPASSTNRPEHLQSILAYQAATTAAFMRPASRAVQQLLAAPPLMFLGACCNSDSSSNGSAAAGTRDDACELSNLLALGRNSSSNSSQRRQ